jgi:hypothetical protein
MKYSRHSIIQSATSVPLPSFHSRFDISSSLHQSPIWIKVSLVMRGSQHDPFPALRGPENLRLLACPKRVSQIVWLSASGSTPFGKNRPAGQPRVHCTLQPEFLDLVTF